MVSHTTSNFVLCVRSAAPIPRIYHRRHCIFGAGGGISSRTTLKLLNSSEILGRADGGGGDDDDTSI